MRRVLTIALLSLSLAPMVAGQGHDKKTTVHQVQHQSTPSVQKGQGNLHRSDRGLNRESGHARVHQSPRSVHVRSVPPGHRGLKLGHYKEHGRGKKLGHFKNRRRVIVHHERRHHHRR